MAAANIVRTVVQQARSTARTSQLHDRSALSLTRSAVSKMKELLQSKPDAIALRVGVKQRGCSGLSYTLEYVTHKDKFDEEVQQDGVTVFIDKKAQLTLLGTEMDYVESQLSSEFVFKNPNAKGTCGCGESFTV